MKITAIVAATLMGGSSANSLMGNDVLAAEGLTKLQEHVKSNGYPDAAKCTLKNAAIRREWSTLSRSEKLNYISAVKCLAKKPAKTPKSVAPGARSRYDDFVVTHVQQSWTIHATANFLTWHRYFTWAYEQALRNECGYKGYQPYWNWAWWAEDPRKSPIFDGSDTSMGGNGKYIPGRNYSCFPFEEPCTMQLYPGSGGGCVTSGPFKDFKVNLGPFMSMMKDLPPNPQEDGLGYNPRCLSRDINQQAANATKDEFITSLITGYKDIASFQTSLQGDFENDVMGVHTGGHYTISGDAGSDFMNSPADPAFFLHHGMIDRTYWTWQNHDLNTRQYSVGGKAGFGDDAPDGTLDDVITMGHVGVPNVSIGDSMHTLGGPFCYIYV